MKTEKCKLSFLIAMSLCLTICAFQAPCSLLNSHSRQQTKQHQHLYHINHIAVDPSEQKANDDLARANNYHQLISEITPTLGPAPTPTWSKKVLTGARVAPILLTLPFYGIGFGIVGHNYMWAFSEWISSMTNPSERWLFDHFDRIKKFCASGSTVASRKSRNYKIHPTFAGLSLITTPILAFVKASKYQHIISRKGLLIANFCICAISVLAGKALINTMLGDAHAKKWNYIQGNLCVAFAAFSACPGPAWIGSLFTHLNWSLLFCVGVLERFYVLSVLSQLHLKNRKTYMDYYSPMMKANALGSIPLGLVTYFMLGRSIV